MDRNLLSRVGAAGAVLGVVGIGLFVLLWVVLGSLGVDTFMRVVISVCVPPALMALGVGVYMLITAQR